MTEDSAVTVQENAITIIQDYEKSIRREKIKMILKRNAVLVATVVAVVYVLNKYAEATDEN